MLLLILIQRRGSLKSWFMVYYAVCGTAHGLMVTHITEAPHSARRAKQLFTVVLPLSPLKRRCSIEDECLLSWPSERCHVCLWTFCKNYTNKGCSTRTRNEVKSTSKTHDILRKEFYLFHLLRRPFYAPEHLFTWGVKWSSGCGKKTTSASYLW